MIAIKPKENQNSINAGVKTKTLKSEQVLQPMSKVRQQNISLSQSATSGKLSMKVDDGFNHMREYLESRGLKANMSMNKKLLQRLYGELKDYEHSRRLPDCLQAIVDAGETETAKDEARLAS